MGTRIMFAVVAVTIMTLTLKVGGRRQLLDLVQVRRLPIGIAHVAHGGSGVAHGMTLLLSASFCQLHDGKSV